MRTGAGRRSATGRRRRETMAGPRRRGLPTTTVVRRPPAKLRLFVWNEQSIDHPRLFVWNEQALITAEGRRIERPGLRPPPVSSRAGNHSRYPPCNRSPVGERCRVTSARRDGGTRTRDPLSPSQVRFRLRHIPVAREGSNLHHLIQGQGSCHWTTREEYGARWELNPDDRIFSPAPYRLDDGPSWLLVWDEQHDMIWSAIQNAIDSTQASPRAQESVARSPAPGACSCTSPLFSCQ